jgi:hypothetical protein
VTGSASSTLFRNGEQVASSPSFGQLTADGLPAEKATYKFVTTGTRTGTAYSGRTELTVTFSSAATEQPTAMPARTVRYQPAVDGGNTVQRTQATVLPIILDGTPGAVLPAVTKVDVQVSGDDGNTWQRASVVRVGSGYQALFATPAGPSVSLKAHVVDAEGQQYGPDGDRGLPAALIRARRNPQSPEALGVSVVPWVSRSALTASRSSPRPNPHHPLARLTPPIAANPHRSKQPTAQHDADHLQLRVANGADDHLVGGAAESQVTPPTIASYWRGGSSWLMHWPARRMDVVSGRHLA